MIGYSREELEQGLIDWRKITAPEFLEISNLTDQMLRERKPTKPFEKEYIPIFTYEVDGAIIKKYICMEYGKNTVCVLYNIKNNEK